MLKQLTLKNWKSFRQAELFFDPLTVLIGTNASGKSNVLDALAFLQRLAQGIKLEDALSGDSNTSGVRGGIEWAALKPGRQFTIEVLFEDENTNYKYIITVNTEPLYLISEGIYEITNDKNDKFRFGYKDNSNGVDFYNPRSILSVSMTTEDSSLPNNRFINIFLVDPVPTKMRGFSRIDKKLENDASNIASVLAGLPIERKIQVEATLSQYLTRLPERDIQKIWAEPVGRLGSDAMIYCEEQWPNQEAMIIDARAMSDGTLRFLGILTALLTRPEGSQLIIEDVDSGLHPSRSGLLLEMLCDIGRERKIDILVTTHNPALLDALGPQMTPFVVVAHRDSQTGESELTLLEDIENLPKLMASGLLGELTTKGLIERSLAKMDEANHAE